MRAKVFRWLVVMGAVGLVGCQSHGGGAVPATEEEAPIFNPCSQLSDDVLRETGVDPATKRATTDPPTGPSSWRICSWNALDGPYIMGVASTSHTQAESRANPDLTGFRDVPIGPRPGLVHQDQPALDPRRDRCYASMAAAQGMFEIIITWWTTEPITEDRCDLAIKHARDLEPHLPK